jgi:multiple antibiotic resistance protein
MIPKAELVSFVAAPFSMMNPLGNLGVFAGMTDGRPEKETRQIAVTCALTVLVMLLVVTWMGPSILRFFGITVDSLRASC